MIGMEITLIDIITIILGIVIPILATKYRKEFRIIIGKIIQLGKIAYIIDELEDIQTEVLLDIRDMLVTLTKGEKPSEEKIEELVDDLTRKMDKVHELKDALGDLARIR